MAYTVAITNQKGGVGKTTTAVNLAAALAIAERRTLLVDADPQGNTTSGVGISKIELQLSLYDVLVEGHPVEDVILPVPGLPYLSVLPATQDLVGAELQLVERPFRESALRRVLEPIEGNYEYIVVDCPPSLGLLTLNVLAAVQALIIPIQCEYYGLEGISQLLNTVRLVQQNINPGLAIGGVLLTMYDSRLNLCRQVAEDAKEYFGPKVFGTPIPRNVRLAEAPSFGKPILLYDMQSVGAKSYLAVGQELLRRVEGANASVMPTQMPSPVPAAAEFPAPAGAASSAEASASVSDVDAQRVADTQTSPSDELDPNASLGTSDESHSGEERTDTVSSDGAPIESTGDDASAADFADAATATHSEPTDVESNDHPPVVAVPIDGVPVRSPDAEQYRSDSMVPENRAGEGGESADSARPMVATETESHSTALDDSAHTEKTPSQPQPEVTT